LALDTSQCLTREVASESKSCAWIWSKYECFLVTQRSFAAVYLKEEFTCIIVWLLVHTSNQGFVHTSKFSAVHITCSLLCMFPSLCSLPVCSLPSFPARSSQWCLWLTRVPSSLSLCIPFPPPPFPLFPALFPFWRLCSLPSFPIDDYVPSPFPYFRLCSLPSFPIDDYVPALFPYWRLCSRPLSLFSIMLLLPFPIFNHFPDTLCPWCPYVTFTRLLEVQFMY
jgi:hypothetical protein